MFITKLIEESNDDKDMRVLFFLNIEKFIHNIDKEMQNKYIFDKLFSYFETDVFINLRLDVVKYLNVILKEEESISNHEFYTLFTNSLNEIESFVNYVDDWRLIVSFLNGINSIDFIYKINVNTTNTILEYLKKYICYDNHLVKLEVAKLAVRLMRSKVKDQVLHTVYEEFYKPNTFYKRRYFFHFIDLCVNNYSITYLVKNGIIDHIINYIDYGIEVANIINMMPKIVPIIENTSHMLNLTKKIEKYKNTKDIEICKV
jgi:hypothetical protein